MNKIYGVVFKEGGKAYNFIGEDGIEINSAVIVETEKGNQYGKVTKINLESNSNMNNIKNIIRVANDKDYNLHLNNLESADRALKKARELSDSLGLDMNIIDSSYTFDRKQLLFNFIASERVDFRELVKELASIYHTRIELRQIGVRDKAREVSGLGQCGRQLCCSLMKNNIETITINMAKNQNIALNPNKINGSCGRLLCCLSYEDDLYSEFREDLPQIGSIIDTKQGSGRVDSVDILNKKYTVIINGERKEFIIE